MRRPALAWGSAAALAVAVALPAVFWEPLHVDEWVALTVAPRSPGTIVHDILVGKGGGPVHFLLEHLFLQWPGGIEGLRLPSLVASLAALPAAGLLARRLAGRAESLLLPAVLALAPLAVELSTFGRMYGLFLATYLWATYAALIAAERGFIPFLFAAGALGALVYVHPIAPLYAAPALAGAGLLARVRARVAVAAAGAFLLGGLAYWIYAFWRLRERYYVAYPSSKPIRATAGRSVVEDSLFAMSPGQGLAGTLFAALAVIGGVALWRRGRAREAVILAVWIVLPVIFFAFVPAGNAEAGSARFYPRYLLPALPWFLLLVVIGCLAARRIIAIALVVLVLGLEANDDRARLMRLHALHLQQAVVAVRTLGASAVLEPAGGRAIEGRPAYLLDEFVALQVPGVRRSGAGVAVRLVGGPPPFVDRIERGLADDSEARRISPRLLIVTSVTAPGT